MQNQLKDAKGGKIFARGPPWPPFVASLIFGRFIRDVACKISHCIFALVLRRSTSQLERSAALIVVVSLLRNYGLLFTSYCYYSQLVNGAKTLQSFTT